MNKTALAGMHGLKKRAEDFRSDGAASEGNEPD